MLTKSNQNKIRFIFIPATILFSILLVFLASELYIRLAMPRYMWESHDPMQDWQIDVRLGWTQKPLLHAVMRDPRDGEPILFESNQDGVMPVWVKRSKKSGTLRIMLFGDSTVVGRSARQEGRITVLLERLVSSRGIRAEVINAGVEGYSTDQELIRMQALVPVYKPDIVACCVTLNDLRANVASEQYGLAKPVFILTQNKELRYVPPDIKDTAMPGFWSGIKSLPKYSALYKFFYPQLLKVRSTLLRWGKRPLLASYPFGDDEVCYYEPDRLKNFDWDLFVALLKQMQKTARDNGAAFFFYLHPAVEEVSDFFIKQIQMQRYLKEGSYDRYTLERVMRTIATENTISFCPLIDYFLANSSRGPFYLSRRDPHANETGYLITAERLTQFMLESGLIRAAD